jgi:TolB-like protein
VKCFPQEIHMPDVRALLCAAIVTGMTCFVTPDAHAQATRPSQNVILILPFASASAADDAWIGKAAQQDLYADLTQGTVLRVLAPGSVPAAADQGDALGKAREMGASFVVFGQTQSAGKEVRLSGQVLGVADGKPLGAIKATGPIEELFQLEDALAGQVLSVLPRNLLNEQALQAVTGMPGQEQPPQSASVPTNPPAPWPSGPYAPSGLHTTDIFGSSTRPTAIEP